MENNQADVYVEEKKVVSVTPVEGETTPLGDAVFLIKFDDETEVKMTNLKFQAMQTTEKSDATSARNALVKELASKIYSMMMEYGVKFSEVDPTLNEVVRLINDGQNTALDILWGNEAYDRSLLDVNRVLITKYGKEKEAVSVAEEGDYSNESTPEGGTADSEDAK